MALYKGNTKVAGVGKSFKPENIGTEGQVLTKTSTGYAFEDLPTYGNITDYNKTETVDRSSAAGGYYFNIGKTIQKSGVLLLHMYAVKGNNNYHIDIDWNKYTITDACPYNLSFFIALPVSAGTTQIQCNIKWAKITFSIVGFIPNS